jgi:hypothetical protein
MEKSDRGIQKDLEQERGPVYAELKVHSPEIGEYWKVFSVTQRLQIAVPFPKHG